MKARPWSRITHIGGPDNPASFPPYAETQARQLLRSYSAEAGALRDVAPGAQAPATNGSAPGYLVAPGDDPWNALIAAAAVSYASPQFAEHEVNQTLRASE